MGTSTDESPAYSRSEPLLEAAHAESGVRCETVTTCAGGLVYLAVLATIVVWNRGTITYSLDDPYIHLAMAENLLSGHYGINLEEPSSPASSILYPLLLAPLLVLQLGSWAPAVINFAATAGNFWLIQRLLNRSGLGPDSLGRTLAVITGVLVGIAFNLIGVAFTGMEHSVHVFVTLLALYGLVEATEAERAPAWLWPVLVAGPLVRFEGLAVSVPALAVLFALGYRRAATLSGAIITASIVGYVLFLLRLGLPPFPTSVLMKSDVASSAVDVRSPFSLVRTFLGNALEAVRGRAGAFVFLLGAGIVIGALAPEVRSRLRRLAVPLVAVTAVVLHLFAGRFGWFERYEIYIALFAFLAMLQVWRRQVAAYAQRSRLGVAAAAVALLVVNVPYIQATIRTPAAARNIYEQQHQMHRFAVEYHRGPVAVNDLGRVSFENPHYVLDLWGLGSEEARQARGAAQSPAWMERLALKHSTAVAMVYEHWFPGGLPESWTQVARLHLGGPRITAARPSVGFYVTGAGDAASVRGELQRFAASLPGDVRLDLLGVPSMRRDMPE